MSSYKSFDIAKLDKAEDFVAWKAQVQAVLTVNGVWQSVKTGISLTPTAEESSKDEIAKSLILLATKSQFHPQIALAKSAKEAWENLNKTMTPLSSARKEQLRRELNGLKMQKTEDMATYCNRGLAMRNEYISFDDVAFSEVDLGRAILSGLPNEYVMIRKIYTREGQFKSMVELMGILGEEEKEIKEARVEEEEPIDVALLASMKKTMPPLTKDATAPKWKEQESKAEQRGSAKCFKCGKTGHFARTCREDKSEKFFGFGAMCSDPF